MALAEKETWNFHKIRRPASLELETVVGAHGNKYKHNLNMKDESANVTFFFS